MNEDLVQEEIEEIKKIELYLEFSEQVYSDCSKTYSAVFKKSVNGEETSVYYETSLENLLQRCIEKLKEDSARKRVKAEPEETVFEVEELESVPENFESPLAINALVVLTASINISKQTFDNGAYLYNVSISKNINGDQSAAAYTGAISDCLEYIILFLIEMEKEVDIIGG